MNSLTTSTVINCDRYLLQPLFTPDDLLLTGRLVSMESKQRMLEILSNPVIHHKVIEGLNDENPDAEIFRKSGSWKHFHADGGIVMDKE